MTNFQNLPESEKENIIKRAVDKSNDDQRVIIEKAEVQEREAAEQEMLAQQHASDYEAEQHAREGEEYFYEQEAQAEYEASQQPPPDYY